MVVLNRKCPNAASPCGSADPFNCADVLVMFVAGSVITVGVFPGAGVEVLVDVTVAVAVAVKVNVAVEVGVFVDAGVSVDVGVNVSVAVAVAVLVGVAVGVSEGVLVAVLDDVAVGIAVGVDVGVAAATTRRKSSPLIRTSVEEQPLHTPSPFTVNYVGVPATNPLVAFAMSL